MPSVLDGWKQLRIEIQGATEDARNLTRVYRTQTEEILAAAESMKLFREEQQREQQQIFQSLLRNQGRSDEYAQAISDGVLTGEELGDIQQGVLTGQDIASALADAGAILGTSGSSSGGGGGGRSGPSGASGDPVSCRIPETDDAINNQTSVLSSWLQELIDSVRSRSYGSQYIGKPLYLRPGQGG